MDAGLEIGTLQPWYGTIWPICAESAVKPQPTDRPTDQPTTVLSL